MNVEPLIRYTLEGTAHAEKYVSLKFPRGRLDLYISERSYNVALSPRFSE